MPTAASLIMNVLALIIVFAMSVALGGALAFIFIQLPQVLLVIVFLLATYFTVARLYDHGGEPL